MYDGSDVRSETPDMMTPYTMRMLGQYLTLTRSQWLDLHDLISSITLDGQAERARILRRLDGEPDQGQSDQSESWRQLAEANGAEAARRGDEVVRLREVETAARALVNAHGPTPVPAWVRLRVDDLKAALDITALPSDG